MFKWLANILVKGWVEAEKLVTTGGTSSDFVKGDGSLDDGNYLDTKNTSFNVKRLSQPSSYNFFVIPLCRLDLATNADNFSHGQLHFKRQNSLSNQFGILEVSFVKYYDNDTFPRYAMRSLGDISPPFNEFFTPVTFEYNGHTWGGIAYRRNGASVERMTFQGTSNNWDAIEMIEYWDSNNNVVLNAEIYGSIGVLDLENATGSNHYGDFKLRSGRYHNINLAGTGNRILHADLNGYINAGDSVDSFMKVDDNVSELTNDARYIPGNHNEGIQPTNFSGNLNNLPTGTFASTVSTSASNKPFAATGGLLSVGNKGNVLSRILGARDGSDNLWFSSGEVSNSWWHVASRDWTEENFISNEVNTWINDSEGNPRLYLGSETSAYAILFRPSAEGQDFAFRRNDNTSVLRIRSSDGAITINDSDSDNVGFRRLVNFSSGGWARTLLTLENSSSVDNSFRIRGYGSGGSYNYASIGFGNYNDPNVMLVHSDGMVTTPKGITLQGAEGGDYQITASDNNGSGVTVRPVLNPNNGDTLFSVESSGSANRFRIEHNGYGYVDDEIIATRPWIEDTFYHRQDGQLTSSDDLDDLPDNGFYSYHTDAVANKPWDDYAAILQLDAGFQHAQLAFGASGSGRLAVRRRDSGNFYAWTEFASQDWVNSKNFLTEETQTLADVTGNGNTTSDNIILNQATLQTIYPDYFLDATDIPSSTPYGYSYFNLGGTSNDYPSSTWGAVYNFNSSSPSRVFQINTNRTGSGEVWLRNANDEDTWRQWYRLDIFDEDGIMVNGEVPYSMITGTPAIPTNNNQLTNGANYITGIDWDEIGGSQSSINLSDFNNDLSYDNYNEWRLFLNGDNVGSIISGSVVNFIEGNRLGIIASSSGGLTSLELNVNENRTQSSWQQISLSTVTGDLYIKKIGDRILLRSDGNITYPVINSGNSTIGQLPSTLYPDVLRFITIQDSERGSIRLALDPTGGITMPLSNNSEAGTISIDNEITQEIGSF